MDDIKSYEDFCKSFRGNEKNVDRANVLLFLQDWIIRINDLIEDDYNDYSVDQLLIDNTCKNYVNLVKKDALSRIIDDTVDAFVQISNNMRENIVRENIMMPMYKVKEINSQGLNWLSRRPGRTIKEKISGTNTMMAVQRRMSIDTGENRLFISFLKEISDLLLLKIDNFPKNQLCDEEYDYYNKINFFFRNNDLSEIRAWENMPPNNTLLSDKNYKKIWNGWNELKNIDDIIKNDNLLIGNRLCELYYIELLTKASNYFRFPQVPVCVNYENYDVSIYGKVFYGIDNNANILKIEKNNNIIKLHYKEKKIKLEFNENILKIDLGKAKKLKYTLKIDNIFRVVEFIFVKIGCNKLKINNVNHEQEIIKVDSIVIDIFKTYPNYKIAHNKIKKLSGRILQQIYPVEIEGNKKDFYLSADKSLALLMMEGIKTYTISSTINDTSIKQMASLMHLMEKYIITNNITFIFPDIYNEFQLSLLHKAARMAYKNVKSFPRSIGIAFKYQQSLDFKNNFKEDDFLLIVDLIDDDITFSLIQGIVSDQVKKDICEYKGIVWERHPSSSKACDCIVDEIKNILIKQGCITEESVNIYNLFGIEGIKDEAESLSLIFDNEKNFSFDKKLIDIIKKVKINITDNVVKFIKSHKEIINSSKIHIISLSENLIYNGTYAFQYMESKLAMEGYELYNELQKKTKVILWRDHLPELSIKMLYGKFNLVNNETITPEFNIEKHIDIPKKFTLPKNTKEYHFNLVQSNISKQITFMAVVKNPAFPLKNDVECMLDMKYKYGAENPYELVFKPIDSKDSGFSEAKVIWERFSEWPYKNLNYPDSIHSLTWEELHSYKGKDGNTIDIIVKLVEQFNYIQKGYEVLDLNLYNIISGRKKFFIEKEIKGIKSIIAFSGNYVEKNVENPSRSLKNSGVVSFEIKEEKNTSKRYTVDLSLYTKQYKEIWRKKEDSYLCGPISLDIDGENVKVIFYENKFDNQQEFHKGISNVSFELKKHKDIYKAINIHDEDSNEEYINTRYIALNIRPGIKPNIHLYSGWFYFIMITAFLGKNSLHDIECPYELKNSFEKAKSSWLNMHKECDNEFIKMRIFSLMSLVAKDIGESYYEIAFDYVDKYMDKEVKLSEYIGYALGDCTTDFEKKLLDKLYNINNNKMICILSKAIWGNEDFIWNIPVHQTIKYFEEAINYLGVLCGEENTNFSKHKKGKDITMCLEYILGVFRLRAYRDEDINKKLSLNNKNVQKLYSYVEKIIENNIEIKSFLKLEISGKGIYEKIPDLLYAILVYITGNQDEGRIRISGINKEDIDI